ncbi:MAG: TetR/AcrR family transcriptional regulator [Pseudomonadales bacterium]|nr:TetR/AcrR family transcriptional regulator [Pseudomonadales bacterium]
MSTRQNKSQHNMPPNNGSRNETHQKLLDATLCCIDRWGVEKTSLNDIAKEAGVTRPTVYSYFTNKDELIQAAMLQVGKQFGEKLFRHFNRFKTPEERMLEAVFFTYKMLPKEPYLGLAIGNDMAQHINERAISAEESKVIRLALFSEILMQDKKYMKDIEEIAEVATRFVLSLLVVEGPCKRTDKETYSFLKRRLLPALGMTL